MTDLELIAAVALLITAARIGNAAVAIRRDVAAIRRHAEARELRELALWGPATAQPEQARKAKGPR
jgi:hypothetical protein